MRSVWLAGLACGLALAGAGCRSASQETAPMSEEASPAAFDHAAAWKEWEELLRLA